MTCLFDAHTQWATRPNDERFASLADLHKATMARHLASVDVSNVNLADMRLQRTDAGFGLAHVNNQSDVGAFTNWSLGQWCTRTGVPRDFLTRISPDLALEVLRERHGRTIQEDREGMTSRVLFGSNGRNVVRAFHGSAYARLWDAEVTQALVDHLPEGWRNPVAYAGGKFNAPLEPSGLYASDRDVFAFFVTGGDFTDGRDWNTVDVNGDVLQRGFYVWNSEVGSTSFGWASFWFRVVCGNHIIWGAEDVEVTRAVHRASVRDTFERGFCTFLQGLGKADTRDAFAALVRAAQNEIAVEITRDREKTLDAATKRFARTFTAAQVRGALDAVISEERNVRGTRWDWLNGFTAHARQMPNADARTALERKAAAVLLGK